MKSAPLVRGSIIHRQADTGVSTGPTPGPDTSGVDRTEEDDVLHKDDNVVN